MMSSAVTISSSGAELIGNGYRIVPIEPGTKRPSLSGWPNVKATAETVELWKSQGLGNYGIGILGEETPGVDLDISDERVLDNVLDWCRENIGVDNTRVGRAPRALFTCRADTPFGKMSSRKFESPDGATHQIEILGKGNQYVAYAIHPDTGKPYAWDGLDPLVIHADMLPTLTPEKAQALIDFFETQVPGDWRPITSASTKNVSEHEGNPCKTAPLHRVRSAVQAIPNNDLAYDDWIKVMLALWAAAGENKADGFQIFDEWSAKSAKYDLDETVRVWDATHEVKHIGAGTLFHLAKQNGWVEPVEDLTAFMDVVEGIPDKREAVNDNLASRSSRFLTYDQMITMPEPEWLVEGVLQRQSAALMFGKSNTFKSFLAIDLLLSVVTGRSWHGQTVKPGRGALIATEGANGVGRFRVPGWFDNYDIPLDVRRNVFLLPHEATLDDKSEIERLIAEVAALGKLDLIVFDIFGGTMMGSEVEDTTARAWVRGVQRLMRATGASTLTVAHTGWADQSRARMHTHFWGSFDTRIKVDGDKEARTSCIMIERHKDADSSGSWGFSLVKQHQTLVPVLDDTAKHKKSEGWSKRQKLALQTLAEAIEAHGEFKHERGWPTEQIVAMEYWRDCASELLSDSDKPDTHKRIFNRVKKELIEKNAIAEKDGFVWLPL